MEKSLNRYYMITVAVCCLLLASSIGACSNSDAVFLSPMSEALGVRRGNITLYTTISGLTGCFLYPLVFRLTKRFLLRRVVMAGIVITAASCVGMGFASRVWIVYLCAVLRGFGVVCYSSSVVNSIFLTRWFRERNSTVSGIVLGATGISGALFNPFFAALILRFGVRAALFARACVVFGLAFPAAALAMKEDPSSVGLEPYRSEKGESGAKRDREEPIGVPLRPKSSLFAAITAYIILISAVARLVDQFPGYAESIGQGPRVGALMASAFMIGNVAAKLLVGVLNDSAGVIKTTLASICLPLLAIGVLLAFPGSVTLLLIGAFLYGMTMALASVSIFALVRYVYGEAQTGAAMSYTSPFTALYTVPATLYGYLYDITGAFTAAFALSTVFCVICALLVLFIARRAGREAKPGSRPKKTWAGYRGRHRFS